MHNLSRVLLFGIIMMSNGCLAEYYRGYQNRRKVDRALRPEHYKVKESRYSSEMGHSFNQDIYARVLRASFDKHGFPDLQKLKRNAMKDLNLYLNSLAKANPAAYRQYEWDTLMINAYNAFILSILVSPPKYVSTQDLREEEIWHQYIFDFGGVETSLKSIENALLDTVNDERVKLTLIYGDKTLARLQKEPYVASKFKKQLEAQQKKELETQAELRALAEKEKERNNQLFH